ncbi:MAG: domain S-box protein [Bradyrhizobium sp.]|jgi:hypothetical protein|nr:domain S-box protein [Bradyrhizobium sp.]
MMRNQIANFWNSAAQFFLSGVALALGTLVLYWLRVDLASAAFGYLIVIVLLFLIGRSACRNVGPDRTFQFTPPAYRRAAP